MISNNNKKDDTVNSMSGDIFSSTMKGDFNAVASIIASDPATVNDQQQETGLTPAHIAAAYGYAKILDLLLAQPEIDIWRKDRWGRDVLNIAIQSGHTAIVDALFIFNAKRRDNDDRSGPAMIF